MYKNMKGCNCLLKMGDSEMTLQKWKWFYYQDKHMYSVLERMENSTFFCKVEGLFGMLDISHFSSIEKELSQNNINKIIS